MSIPATALACIGLAQFLYIPIFLTCLISSFQRLQSFTSFGMSGMVFALSGWGDTALLIITSITPNLGWIGLTVWIMPVVDFIYHNALFWHTASLLNILSNSAELFKSRMMTLQSLFLLVTLGARLAASTPLSTGTTNAWMLSLYYHILAVNATILALRTCLRPFRLLRGNHVKIYWYIIAAMVFAGLRCVLDGYILGKSGVENVLEVWILHSLCLFFGALMVMMFGYEVWRRNRIQSKALTAVRPSQRDPDKAEETKKSDIDDVELGSDSLTPRIGAQQKHGDYLSNLDCAYTALTVSLE